MLIIYRLFQAIVAIVTAVLLYFFVTGQGDGSITSSNLFLWLVLLAIPIGGLFLTSRLNAAGRRVAACVLLAAIAAPALLYGLFVGLIILGHPDFK